MSFDWSENLYLARELVGKPDKASNEEVKLRAALSRAYYAAFGKARNYLQDNTPFIASSSKDTHWDVINQFLHDSNPARRQIGWDLRYLFNYRKQADYDNDFSRLSAQMVESALDIAERVISRLAKLK